MQYMRRSEDDRQEAAVGLADAAVSGLQQAESSLAHILQDPRPNHPDTRRWRAALLLVHRLGLEPERAIELGSRLWTMRTMGTALTPSNAGLRFTYFPGAWADFEEYESFKRQAFGDYRDELVQLLNQVERVADKREVPESWKAYVG